MTIRINQIPVEFTLETEKTFADLTASLRAWATGQNLAILGILVDGKALGPEDRTPLEGFGSIEVEAVPAGERDLARVAVIGRFFGLITQAWGQQDQPLIQELHLEYPAVRSALFPLLAPVVQRLSAPLLVLDGPWDDPRAIAEASQAVAAEAERVRRELQDPVAALTQTLRDLRDLRVPLETLPTLFQTGRDRDGFSIILSLLTVLEDLGRRGALVPSDPARPTGAWEQFQSELNPFLLELEGALGAGDYVLLTDLLEYEVTPRLRALDQVFPGLVNLDPVPDVL